MENSMLIRRRSRNRPWVRLLAAAVAVAAATAGCGRSQPPLSRVQGVVTLEGKPLSHGTVSFVPDGSRGTKGRMAIGSIGPDGRFELQSFKADDGALVGFHKVAISCEELPPAPADGAAPPPPAQFKSLIPVRYNDSETSGLSAEVKRGVENEFVFELKAGKP